MKTTFREKAKNVFAKFVKELNEYSETYAKIHVKDISDRK